MIAYRQRDAIGVYLTGGASNSVPALSLGGTISSYEMKGMSAIVTTPVQALVIEYASPENEPGTASISISGDYATYTPPDGNAGAPVQILGGERQVLTGSNQAKFIRVYRYTGQTFTGTMSFRLVDAITGLFSMGHVASDDRVAGLTTYRGFVLKAHGDLAIFGIKAWIESSVQASYQLAKETPAAGAIQTIADETTAPAAVSFSDAVHESSAITESVLTSGQSIGLWAKRVFPASGVVSVEDVKLCVKFKGA